MAVPRRSEGAQALPRAARDLPAGDLHELGCAHSHLVGGSVERSHVRGRQRAEVGVHAGSTVTGSWRPGPLSAATGAPRAAISMCPALPITAASCPGAMFS